jgi:hypothetical protein
MEIVALAIVCVGFAAIYAWWDVKRGNRSEEQLVDRVNGVEQDIRGIWQRLRPIEELANTTCIQLTGEVKHLSEQMLDTRNSVAGLKGIAPKVRKYG